MSVRRVLTVRILVILSVFLAVAGVVAACGRVDSISRPSSTTTSDLAPTAGITQPNGTLQTLSSVDGWTITLIPGTDKIRGQYDQIPESVGLSSNQGGSPPGPSTFEPSVATDGGRVVYSAYYGGRPQVYLYDIASGTVTQVTNDPADSQAAYGEMIQVQISGDWVAWQRGNNTGAIFLHNLATGETRQFQPRETVTSWRLTGGRLAWVEGIGLQQAQLYLYDPAVGSPQTIASAHGLVGFAMDNKHLAWVGGANGNEMCLYDLATGKTKKVTDASQHPGDLVLRDDVLAWVERYGDLSKLFVCSVQTGETKELDEFGPFNPELQSDGRYLAWNRGEEATGTEVRVYDTKTGVVIELGDVTVEEDSWPALDAGRIAWTRAYRQVGKAMTNEVIMVRDLPDGPALQLTDSPWIDQPPSMSGDHIAWTRDSSPDGVPSRAIFVASHTGS
jgi:hypothetical protein